MRKLTEDRTWFRVTLPIHPDFVQDEDELVSEPDVVEHEHKPKNEPNGVENVVEGGVENEHKSEHKNEHKKGFVLICWQTFLRNPTWAGRQPLYGMRHNFGVSVSPFANKKNEKLLPLVHGKPIVKEGEADSAVQACCFRPIMTNDPANRIPIERPENYNPAVNLG